MYSKPPSIPGGVTGDFFHVPPTEPCALRSTQPLKVSTRDFSWGKGGRCVWLTNYHPCSAETSRKSGALIYPEPLGPPRPVAGHLYLYLLKPSTTEFRHTILWIGQFKGADNFKAVNKYINI